MATPEPILDLSSDRSATATDRAVIQLWQTIGAAKVVNQIVASLGSQSLHALERVRDEKLYLAAGFETFREFLDKHPESPMSYDQFNRRTKLLEIEGDFIFDLLSSLNVPWKDRKLLAGQIEVEGNEIRIGEARTRLDDEAAIINLIASQQLKLQEQQRTNERLSKKLKKGEEDFEKLKRRAIIANPDGTETGQALLTAAGALAKLREALAAATDEEKQALREEVFELLRVNQLECSVALGVIKREELTAAGPQSDDEITGDEAVEML